MVVMNPRSKNLFDAVKSYVSFAEQWLKDQAIAQPKLFFLTNRDELIGIVNEKLRNSPQYQQCLDELLKDPVVAAQLDVGVGIVGQSWMMLTPWHVMRSLLYIARFQGPFEFVPNSLNEEYEEFESSFYEDEIGCEAIGPIQGLAIGANIKLSESLEIGRITDDEKQAAYRFGLMNRDLSWAHDRFIVVRAKYTLPKFVGSAEEHRELDTSQSNKIMSIEEERIDMVVAALRAFKPGGVSLRGIVHRRHTWLYKGLDTDRHCARPVLPGHLNYTLSDLDEAEAYRSFWNSLQDPKVTRRKHITLALQRLDSLSDRRRDEDKIIDLLIAAEALFLDGGDQGELTHRLSMRAGFFLSSQPETRKKISQHMRKAYQIRSAIVHGSTSSKHKGGREELQEIVRNTEIYIRSALHKTIQLAVQAKAQDDLVDWENLIFGIVEPSANSVMVS